MFQQDKNTKLLSLKSNITLHLYMNQMPKGAAQIPSNLLVTGTSKTPYAPPVLSLQPS